MVRKAGTGVVMGAFWDMSPFDHARDGTGGIDGDSVRACRPRPAPRGNFVP